MQKLFCALVALVLVGCQTAAPDKGKAELVRVRREILAASQEWDRVFNAGDAERLVELYAEDAISMPPNGLAVRGRFALRKDFEGLFAANLLRHETVVEDLIVEGDLAIERARYRMTMKPKQGGAEAVEVTEIGKHVEVRRKIGGRWLIVVEIWNQDAPPPK